MKGNDNQLGAPVAVHIDPTNAMYRRLGCDVVHLARMADPMERAARVRIRWLPVRSQREIRFAVAVDIVRSDGDIVMRGHPLRGHVFRPARILKPQNLGWIDGDDVRLAVPVHVSDRDGVDNAQAGRDFLSAKHRSVRCKR